MKRDDGRVLQPSGDSHLPFEALASGKARLELLLDGDFTSQSAIKREQHPPHPTSSKLLSDFIAIAQYGRTGACRIETLIDVPGLRLSVQRWALVGVLRRC